LLCASVVQLAHPGGARNMKIAVFLPNWVGDAVMATPALRALRRQFAAAHILGVLRPYVAGILDGAPWVDRTLLLDTRGPWSRRSPRAASAPRRQRVDLPVLSPNSPRSALVARLGGCGRLVGYARGGRSWLLTDRLEPVRARDGSFPPS